MDNRKLCNIVLAQINAETIIDIEWEAITLPTNALEEQIFNACLSILQTRTLVDNTIDKLIALAYSKGINLKRTDTNRTFSNILIGVPLSE